MYVLEKKFRFEASHQLPEHDGKCRRLHGHSWVLVVKVAGAFLVDRGPKSGMLVDYGDISAIVAPLVEQYLDHHHLNDTLAGFGVKNPTSEAICEWLFRQLRPQLPMLVSVRIEETCTSACEFSGP